MARKAYGLHATQVNTGTYADDPAYPIGSNEWNEALDPAGMLGFTPATANSSTIVIASGVATITDSIAVIAAESSTSDTLDKVAITNTNQYDLVYLFADSGDTITLTHTSSPSADGHVKTVSGQDETLSETSPIILIRKGAYWYGYGGGVVNAVSDIGDVTITSNSSGEILKWNGSAWINQTLAEAGVAASGAKLSDFAATSSSELAGAISDETGSGALAFATSPTLVTPALGTPASGVATNLTGTAASLTAGNATLAATVTTNANLTGGVTSVGNAATVITNANLTGGVTSVGNAATVVTNANLTGDVTSSGNATTLGTVAVAKGGTNLTSYTAGDIVYASGTTTLAKLNVGSNTNVLTLAGGVPTWAAAASSADTPWGVVHNFADYYYDMEVQTKPSDPAADHGRFYVKEVDSDNDGLFCLIRKNGAFEETQIV